MTDLFGVVLGPATVIIDGDVVLDDGLGLPAVERATASAAAGLSREWPSIVFLYLDPVAAHPTRRGGGAAASP